MPSRKMICAKCRAEGTITEDGRCTAIAWKCSRCTRGACRHCVSYSVKKGANEPKICSECYIEALDHQAINKGNAA